MNNILTLPFRNPNRLICVWIPATAGQPLHCVWTTANDLRTAAELEVPRCA